MNHRRGALRPWRCRHDGAGRSAEAVPGPDTGPVGYDLLAGIRGLGGSRNDMGRFYAMETQT